MIFFQRNDKSLKTAGSLEFEKFPKMSGLESLYVVEYRIVRQNLTALFYLTLI